MTSEDDWFREALDHHRAGRLHEAAQLYQKVLKANPGQADALYLLGAIAHQTGYHAQAVELCRRALAAAPDDARCYNVLGLALMELGKDAEAEDSFQKAIAIDNNPEVYNNLGTLCKKQGRLDDAIAAYRRALARSPAYANAHYNLGNAYRDRKEMESAAECFQQALSCNPEHANALVGLGQALQALRRAGEAVPILERALVLISDDAELYCDLGDALQTLGQLQGAIDQYRKALSCNPRLTRAWYSAGCAESSRNEHAAASICFRRALESDPDRREAQHNLGHSLFKLGQVEDALKLFRQAAAVSDPEAAEAAIAVSIPGDPGSSNPATLEARRTWAERYLPSARPAERFSHSVRSHDRPLRIGYVSAFFQDHNWMKPVWGLINRHDRQRFEVHLFSDAPESSIQHGYTRRSQDQFHDITGLSAEAAADRVEQAGIDVLVDLNGYSAMGRLPLIALRPAPAVVAWFNMYATSGMSCYDCLVGDDVVIPPEEEQFYTERIVRVPGSYLTFEVTYPVPEVTSPPCSAGRAITFGCLAPQYKITKDVIARWSTILQQVPHSSLILKNSALGSPGNRRFVHGLFESCEIAAERVLLEGPSDHYRFLETYNRIDIALDTFPYNGGTTTTEAIWQGVPVVTFWGDRWVSRTSASILRAGGLGEFVAQGMDDYISAAVRLANSPDRPDRLRELRRTMRSRLLESPVCDTRGFARNMERLYWSAGGLAAGEPISGQGKA
jgi:predicted O-linked N-acetylglucosamine transferase (SPINDLY family)